MKILIDTNVLFSAILFPHSRAAKAVIDISKHHDIYLCDQNLRELRAIVKRKIPEKLGDMNILIGEMRFVLIPSIYSKERVLRDKSDEPIIKSAIINGIDLILTGDKDFLESGISTPKSITIDEYFKKKY